MGSSEQRPLALDFRLGSGFGGQRLPVGLGVTRNRARQDGGRRVRRATVVLAALHLVLQSGERRAGLFLHREVKHAGRHVVPHELDADLDTASVFPFF